MKKNDIVTVQITGISSEGLGIGHFEGLTVFVKDTVPGDLAKASLTKIKKTYAYARPVELLEESPSRVRPRCPVARPCGGCQLQMLAYPDQLNYKTEKVLSNLKRIGGLSLSQEVVADPIMGMEEPWRYRNKAQYPVGEGAEGEIRIGFYAGRTHSIIPMQDCCLGITENQLILSCIKDHMEGYHVCPYHEEDGSGLVRHVLIRKAFATGELMVCLVLNGKTIPGEEELVRRLREIPGMTSISINVNCKNSNVILGERLRLLWGKPFITDRIGDLQFQISPLAFFQVNPVQTERLYAKVLEYANLTGKEVVWDLYCGIGTISLCLARKARMVYGVEIIPQAVENAKTNAVLNKLENAVFYTGKAEIVTAQICQDHKARPDLIVVDPPRKGCDVSLLDTMITMAPDKIIYVSCDSATLARDLKYLCSNGYRLERFCPVDMFPQTVHVETVCLLGRRKPDDTIKVSVNMDDYYQIRDAEEAEKNPS